EVHRHDREETEDQRDPEHDRAGPPDVIGVALGDAVADDVRVEIREVQGGHRLEQQDRRDDRDLAPIRCDVPPKQTDQHGRLPAERWSRLHLRLPNPRGPPAKWDLLKEERYDYRERGDTGGDEEHIVERRGECAADREKYRCGDSLSSRRTEDGLRVPGIRGHGARELRGNSRGDLLSELVT